MFLYVSTYFRILLLVSSALRMILSHYLPEMVLISPITITRSNSPVA